VPSNAIATVEAAQQADGGWNFLGDPTGTGADPDETGLALQALVAGGLDAGNAHVQRGLALLASSQQASGAWVDFFGTDGNPSSTAFAILGIAAAGYDVTSSCWRDAVLPARAGASYGDPDAWIRSQQAADGHIVSPYDSADVNTLTTSQAVQGLLRSWLPIARAPVPTCAAASPESTTPTTTSVPAQVVGEAVTRPVTFAG
jgi:hypothetical protein